MNEQEFTGERFIPGQGGVQLAYEHLHRYLFAMQLALGKQVLDVASGSGYGTGLLAKVARRVLAIDMDNTSISQARRTVRDPNIGFVNADGTRLPVRSSSMELVVAFEVIEHVPDQEGMIRELARVLEPGGVVLISTPNKAVYSDARKYVNPFHLREFYRDEFMELLHRGFPFVRLLHQQVRAGSLITGCESTARTGEILTGPIPGEEHAETASMYFLACCSDGNESLPAQDSAYFDPADSLIREWRRREIESGTEAERLNHEIERLGRWGKELDSQLSQRDEALRNLQSLSTIALKSRDETIRRLQQELEGELTRRDNIIHDLRTTLAQEISQRDSEIKKLQGEFEERTRWAQSLQDEIHARDELLRSTNAALDASDASLKAASGQLARIRHAFLYRVLYRVGILPG